MGGEGPAERPQVVCFATTLYGEKSVLLRAFHWMLKEAPWDPKITHHGQTVAIPPLEDPCKLGAHRAALAVDLVALGTGGLLELPLTDLARAGRRALAQLGRRSSYSTFPPQFAPVLR